MRHSAAKPHVAYSVFQQNAAVLEEAVAASTGIVSEAPKWISNPSLPIGVSEVHAGMQRSRLPALPEVAVVVDCAHTRFSWRQRTNGGSEKISGDGRAIIHEDVVDSCI